MLDPRNSQMKRLAYAYHQETEYQSCSSLSKLRVNPILQLESAALTGALERIHPKVKLPPPWEMKANANCDTR